MAVPLMPFAHFATYDNVISMITNITATIRIR